MKKYGLIIIILGIIFYLSYMVLAQENIFNTGQHQPVGRNDTTEPENQNTTESQKIDFNSSEGNLDDMEEETYMANDMDIFARKLFQKKLPPLSNKEKIIWAFRMSKNTIFL